MQNCDVAIVGAGPYGLSIAAHLKASGVGFRIFGEPMGFWLNHMPRGMHLKSEGFASSLFEPSGQFTLASYCKERRLEYADIGKPVPLDVFASYGMEFQKRYVPQVETEKVLSVQRFANGFRLVLENGETFSARRVVVAVGQSYYAYVPPELSMLPKGVATHSSEHSVLDRFSGSEVAVIGGGASALDLAALLKDAGASVTVVARVPRLRYHDQLDTGTPSFVDKLRTPITGIGPGWKPWLCANLPLVFRLMPEEFRIDKVRVLLGPAACWFMRERVEGRVKLELGSSIKEASVAGDEVCLDLVNADGVTKKIRADHVIAATGFKSDLRRLQFLDTDIVEGLKCTDRSPALSSNFESTIPGLYFVGVTAANTFGPLLRFAVGAGFAAPRISRHLAKSASSPSAFNGSSSVRTEEHKADEPVSR